MSEQEYQAYVQKKSRPSPLWKDLVWAFLVGGAICALGEGLREWCLAQGLEKDMASGAVSVSLIFLSTLTTGLGVFDRLAKHAGAGTLVPITGFANAVAAPALEFRSEGLIMGVGAKLFVIAGPVLTYGIAASVVYGLVLLLLGGGGGA